MCDFTIFFGIFQVYKVLLTLFWFNIDSTLHPVFLTPISKSAAGAIEPFMSLDFR